jgi:Uma2 family endonuclease
MPMLVSDPIVETRLKAEREASGADRWDEVWEGTYMMAPLPNNEHQELQLEIAIVLHQATAGMQARVFPGVNVSDRVKGWEHNYRCPDVVVYLPNTTSRSYGTHWVGGPDLAVEIISPGDRTREKLAFYGTVNTRELLILDRDPWSLEVIHFPDGKGTMTARATPANGVNLSSTVLPLTFRLEPGQPRPRIVVTHRDTAQTWTI